MTKKKKKEEEATQEEVETQDAEAAQENEEQEPQEPAAEEPAAEEESQLSPAEMFAEKFGDHKGLLVVVDPGAINIRDLKEQLPDGTMVVRYRRAFWGQTRDPFRVFLLGDKDAWETQSNLTEILPLVITPAKLEDVRDVS